MINPEQANRVLLSNPEFMQLRGRFNLIGVVRFFVYVAAVITALAAGFNQAYGVLVISLIASFVLVMVLNYNRSAILARQQGIALRLGVITEEDLRR
ncbi:hypothetical protein M2152_002462 [Microbacteriaceae bacterium SG_E_30_P1]|uniref:DUF202 domain-containing protein n=1 Tax=Antiquaquibacter oligotrophicus TaxID=2880260 RepID=A0ABT6KQL8_9MICO|nr:hypothetical protein [Antiquaquibacter oligotrophicus]MDH6182280.1 hypothetical protein [Antiquaquibacter oligotrophicus]UDF12063.1 hypothetical protein LH407_07750 [Antiquaquibacter oligotrophicus]